MEKSLNQSLFIPETSSLAQMKSEQDEVSIDNFDQNSKKVRMTEKATIEAMNRLGFTNDNLSYRSYQEFKRPGCDDSVTQLLYNKYEEKRQKIIKEITEMRNTILKEKEQNKIQKQKKMFDKNSSKDINENNTPLIRIEIASIQKEKQNLNNLKIQKDKDLKKIVITKFRDYFQHQQYKSAMQKTIEKTEQIAQMKSQIIKSAREKANHSCLELPKRINSPKTNESPKIDHLNEPLKESKQAPMENVERHIENLMKLRSEEAKKREEIRKKNEIHLKIAHERSIEQQEKNREEKIKKINLNELRYQRWKDEREQINQQRIERIKARQKYEMNAVQNRQKIEEENQAKMLMKLNSYENRSRTQTELYKSAIKSRIESNIIKMNERSKKCQLELDKQRNEREEYRKKLEEKDLSLEAKLKKQSLDTTLKYLSRKIDRDDKIENAKRIVIQKEYLNELKNKKRFDDSKIVADLHLQKQKISNQITSTDLFFNQKKQEILDAFNKMNAPDDPNSKKKLARLLNVQMDEIDNLILCVKSTMSAFSRPKTALQTPRSNSTLSCIDDSRSEA